MTDGQRRELQDIVDDYTEAEMTRDQIVDAVRRRADQINPPPISSEELDAFIASIP